MSAIDAYTVQIPRTYAKRIAREASELDLEPERYLSALMRYQFVAIDELERRAMVADSCSPPDSPTRRARLPRSGSLYLPSEASE